jgi:hypothetical protein
VALQLAVDLAVSLSRGAAVALQLLRKRAHAKRYPLQRLCSTSTIGASPTPKVQHMAGKNPRITVSLTPSLVATLAGISKESGESTSSIVRGLLVQSEPAFQRMWQLFKAANTAKGQIGGGTGAALAKVVDDLEDALAVADARLHRATRDLVAGAETVEGRRRRNGAAGTDSAASASKGGANPRSVTRGSGTGKPGKTGVRGGHGS